MYIDIKFLSSTSNKQIELVIFIGVAEIDCICSGYYAKVSLIFTACANAY